MSSQWHNYGKKFMLISLQEVLWGISAEALEIVLLLLVKSMTTFLEELILIFSWNLLMIFSGGISDKFYVYFSVGLEYLMIFEEVSTEPEKSWPIFNSITMKFLRQLTMMGKIREFSHDQGLTDFVRIFFLNSHHHGDHGSC